MKNSKCVPQSRHPPLNIQWTHVACGCHIGQHTPATFPESSVRSHYSRTVIDDSVGPRQRAADLSSPPTVGHVFKKPYHLGLLSIKGL